MSLSVQDLKAFQVQHPDHRQITHSGGLPNQLQLKVSLFKGDLAIISVVKPKDENHAACGTIAEASIARSACHGWPCLSIALRIVNSFCIQATNATFFALPRANNC